MYVCACRYLCEYLVIILRPLETKVISSVFVNKQLDCCGSVNYTDWWKNPGFANTSSVPDSCCKHPAKDCGLGALAQTNPTEISQVVSLSQSTSTTSIRLVTIQKVSALSKKLVPCNWCFGSLEAVRNNRRSVEVDVVVHHSRNSDKR